MGPKRNQPLTQDGRRGRREVPRSGDLASSAGLAMTLLLLWAETLNLDRASLRDGMTVLCNISAGDGHASRTAGRSGALVVTEASSSFGGGPYALKISRRYTRSSSIEPQMSSLARCWTPLSRRAIAPGNQRRASSLIALTSMFR